MKKLIFASLLVLALGTFAFAQQGGGMGRGMGQGHGMGMGNNGGYGYDGGYCNGGGYGHGGGHGWKQGNCNGPRCMQGDGYYAQPEAVVKTADEAKAKVQEVLKTDFKGYKITKTEEFASRNGNKSFSVITTDASGNEFIFHVNPYGNVRGPWLSKNTPK